MTKDEWIIARFSGGEYEVATDGRLYSRCAYRGGKERLLKTKIHPKTGYEQIVMSDRTLKKSLMCLVHRIVALIHIPNPLGLPQVNHKDGNKSNNAAVNLEWVSVSENIKHSLRTGLKIPICGEKVAGSKLTGAEVVQIRAMRVSGKTYKEIAKVFEIHEMTVGEICRKEIWKSV